PCWEAGICFRNVVFSSQNDSQNAPYPVNAAAANALRSANAHMPASSWAKPPKKIATGITTGRSVLGRIPSRIQLSIAVVSAKPDSPRGTGSAGSQAGTARGAAAAGVGASLLV